MKEGNRCSFVSLGTPGRLVDHLENTKGFNLRSLKFLVIIVCFKTFLQILQLA